ncbi:MAG TPA: MBL fold metallo-hydrolase [Longimicrobium sp.]
MRRMMAVAAAALIPAAAQAQMKAHFINVGQGQSVLLEFQTAAVLVDAGGEADAEDRDHVIAYLDSFFVGRPDLDRTLYSVIVTHPHIDHTRYLMDVMRGYRVRNLVDGGRMEPSQGAAPVIEARRYGDEHGVLYNIVPDSRIASRGYQTYRMRVLREGPSDVDIRFVNGAAGCRNENNNSVAALVRYREASFLIPGDAENESDGACEPAIRRMVRRFTGGLLDVDVYAAGHHASRNGTTTNYLTMMSPQITVISAGHHTTQHPPVFNPFDFGHPREAAVAMMESATTGTRPAVTVYTMDAVRQVRADRVMEKAVYCTCWDGDVVVEVDGTGTQLAVRTTRP